MIYIVLLGVFFIKMEHAKKLEGLVNMCEFGIEGPFWKCNAEDLKGVATSMYGDEVTSVREVEDPGITLRIIEALAGNKPLGRLIVKDAWEGGIKEGIGQELYNLIAARGTKYACCHDYFASEFIPRKNKELSETVSIINTSEFAYNYGRASEFASFLALGDRGLNNLIITKDTEVVHIDFGYLFYPDYEDMLPFSDCEFDESTFDEGREDARIAIYDNLLKNRIKVRDIVSTLRPNFLDAISKDIGCCVPYAHIQQYARNAGWIKDEECLFETLERDAA